jgi:hypothetical protein
MRTGVYADRCQDPWGWLSLIYLSKPA